MSRSDGIKGRFALFCDNAFTSSDGKLNIIGEFNQIFSTQQKPVLNTAFIVGCFKGDPGSKVDIEVRLTSEKGEDVLPRQELTITCGPGGGANVLMEVKGIQFPELGTYKVAFRTKGELLADAEVQVSRVNEHAPAKS